MTTNEERYVSEFENWEPTQEFVGTAFATRRMFFEKNVRTHTNDKVPCPACGYPTIGYRGGYEYCSICHWEDDMQDDPWADEVFGPNDVSLVQARRNFAETLCMWQFEEVGHMHVSSIDRLFSEATLNKKQELCRLYDELMTLHTNEQIKQQHQLIDAQWKVVP